MTTTKKRVRVYVACPITPHGKVGKHPCIEYLENIRRGVEWSIKVWKAGGFPFTPPFDFVYWLVKDAKFNITEEMVKGLSMAWLEGSDVVFVIPDERGFTSWLDSSGVLDEIERAKELKIPVFHKFDSMIRFVRGLCEPNSETSH